MIRFNPSKHLAVWSLFGLLLTSAALAQSNKPVREPPKLTPPPSETVELETEPFEIPPLGLSLYLPVGSLIDSSRLAGGETMVRIISPYPDWLMQVFAFSTMDPGVDCAAVLETIIQTRRNREQTGLTAAPLHREDNLTIADLPAARAYIGVLEDKNSSVTGYTVFQRTAGEFVIIQMDCPQKNFPNGRKVYETVVATARFTDPALLSAARMAVVLAGDAFLASLTSRDLEDALLAEPAFYRIYKPAKTGSPADAEEVAYQRLQMRKGQLGELNPDRPKTAWSPHEREFGYLVRVDARTLHQGNIVDSQAIYFLSTDRARETWSVINVIRPAEGEPRSITQTVVREDRKLTVTILRGPGEPEISTWTLPTQGYISRVELYLLPRLVAAKNVPVELGFYAYSEMNNRVSLRRDVFEKDPLGTWKRTSTIAEVTDPLRDTLDAAGNLLRRELPEGQIVEPIERERLQRIWSGKSLQMAPTSP